MHTLFATVSRSFTSIWPSSTAFLQATGCGRSVAATSRSFVAAISLARANCRSMRQCATGARPAGPIRMLTHLRYGGYSFNPVTFYYCHASDGELDSIVAEITNTPWRERHAYVLAAHDAERRGRALGWQFGKEFHVSPFMPMQRHYGWRFAPPGENLLVHMQVMREQTLEFDATLALKRRPLDAPALRRVLWRYPLMSAQVTGAIHWQALRLWLKGNPVYEHPQKAPVHEA
jgi:uncharacterized protein